MKIKYLILSVLFSLNLYALGITGQKAPSFGVDAWLQTNNVKKTLDIEDLKGKVVYLYGFQSWCPGCHKYGFPALQKLSKHYKGNDKIAFVAIQTVFEGFMINSQLAAKLIIKKYDLDMPVGHSGTSDIPSRFMQNYKSGGTPWTVVIDKNSIVRFNDFHADSDKLIEYLDMLIKE